MKAAADALFGLAVGTGDVPGVVAALTTREGTVYEGAFGVRVLGEAPAMDADTVMWIASMTKPVVGAAAMQLVEQGRIGLDDPASKLVPELGEAKVLTGWDAGGQPVVRPPRTSITLRMLLTHTSGFAYDTWNPDMARYTKLMNLPSAGSGRNIALGTPLAFDPGTRWEYGIGIDWAGKMVEAASGMRLGQYIERHIAGPLGMDSTAFRITPDMRARLAKVHQRGEDGSLSATAIEVNQAPEFESGGSGDYQRFLRMVLNGGTGNGNRILEAKTLETMSRNAMGALRVAKLPAQNRLRSRDVEFFPGVPKSWGLSFMINETVAPTGRSAGSLAWAGLANTYFWIDPAKGIAGLVMMQILPFVDEKALELFYAFEKEVYLANDQA